MSAETLQGWLLIIFGLPTAITVALFFRVIYFQAQGDYDRWEPLWRRCKVTAILAACCLPVFVVTAYLSYERTATEDKQQAATEAAQAAHQASLSPAQKFQECLDDHFGVDACSTSYGTKAEYIAWMQAKGYPADVARSMANLPPGESRFSKMLKDCAEGGPCNTN